MQNTWRWLVFVSMLLVLALADAQQTKKPPPKNPKQLQQKLSSIQQQKAKLQAAIRQKKKEARKVRRDLAEIDQHLQETSARLDHTQNRLQKARQEQKELQKRLQILTERLKQRQTLLAQRLRTAYKHGPVSYLNVLTGARSMHDLMSRGYVVRRIVNTDRQLMQEVKETREAVAAAKKRQDQLVREITGLEQDLQQQAQEYQEAQEEKQDALHQINSQVARYQQQARELEEESRRIANALKAYQQTAAGRARAARPWSGRFSRPLAGRFTSGFGMRHHPILGVVKMHTGIDLAAPSGTLIHAADGGTVVEAGYRLGYGNTVIIDHGGGVATLYAHCSALLVSPGQVVQKGAAIARVGSTGYATGPHLHFEVRINGEPVNPSQYGVR